MDRVKTEILPVSLFNHFVGHDIVIPVTDQGILVGYPASLWKCRHGYAGKKKSDEIFFHGSK
jgi:hypothetical protein